MPRRVTSADQTSIAVHERGPAGGPTVLAVHGYPDNHSVWDGLADELADDFRFVTYDVRGTGDSAAPTGRSGYRIARLIDDLIAVLDAVSDGQPVHLLAHDWGSIQCWAALTDPRVAGRIASYTSISGPSLDHAGRWLRQVRAHPGASARQLAHSFYIGLFLLPRVPELAIRRGILDRAIAEANARARGASSAVTQRDYRDERDKINGLELYRANMLASMRSTEPARIDLPVFVIAPERDAYLTPRLCFEAPEPFVADLHTRRIAGGHWIVAERPEVIAGCVREFVAHVTDGTPLAAH